MSLGDWGATPADNNWAIDGSAVGPQTDGTYAIPDLGQSIQPADAGGGLPADYSSGVLDIFKYGVGVWQQQQNQSQLLDYKRFEATQKGLVQQGQPVLFTTGANGQASPTVWLFGGIILLAVLLTHKG